LLRHQVARHRTRFDEGVQMHLPLSNLLIKQIHI
jgi:hypothetical protein